VTTMTPYEASDYYDIPHKQSPTFHSKCRINKGLIKTGKHNRSLKVKVQGHDLMAHPSYIHSFIPHEKRYYGCSNRVP
jgi:hypothetical protein